MSDGATLKRAASELTIVVVGVVIALAADGWRQDMADRRTEAAYLERLREDLKADQAAMKSLQARMAAAQRATLELVAALDATERSTSDEALVEFVLTSTKVGFVREALIHDETYHELSSTGRLALIRDAEIRRATSEHYRAVESVAREIEEEMPIDVPRRLRRATGHRAAYYDGDTSALSPQDQARLLAAFRADSESASDLRELHVWLEMTSERLAGGLRDLAELIDLLR